MSSAASAAVFMLVYPECPPHNKINGAKQKFNQENRFIIAPLFLHSLCP